MPAAPAPPPVAKSASVRPTPKDDVPPPGELSSLEHYADFSRFEDFCRDCLKIVDKLGVVRPFILNSSQRIMLAKIRELLAAGIPPRIVLLKARQVGMSTLVAALNFWDSMVRGNRSTLVVAHVAKSSKILFRMSRTFQRQLPQQLKQKTRLHSVNEIELDNGSRIQVETQGDPRGYAAQRVHLSEFAFYERPEDTLVAIMQTLPRSIDSLCVVESTANGVGNKFHRMWQRATEMDTDEEVSEDEKGWTPIFIPWFQHEEYEIHDGVKLLPTGDELRMMARHKTITHAKLKWRRIQISTNLDGDEEKFAQEFPATPDEAFARSGRPAFDVNAVAHYREKIATMFREKRVPPRQEIESDPPGIGKAEIVDYEKGRLRIFFPPQDRHTYIVGADPSEGDPGSDGSPLAVLDQMTLNLAATWYGRTPPDLLAVHAVDLAKHYRDALIVGEANNHGILFNETVLQLGYSNLYFRKVSDESVAGQFTEKPGFLTTRRTREHLFNTLRKYVRMEAGAILCPNMLKQMESLVYIDDKAEAQEGSEKDLLVAFALCVLVHRGSQSAPLEPLPEEMIRSVASEAQLIKERYGPDAAAAHVSQRFMHTETGMTMQEVLDADEAIVQRDARRRRFGLAGMR